jgi:proteasome assembly chaperone (PAC2) family protein
MTFTTRGLTSYRRTEPFDYKDIEDYHGQIYQPPRAGLSMMLGLRYQYRPRTSAPSLIAGLPDMGNVAGMGMDFLISSLRGELFAEILSEWPPFISHRGGQVEYHQQTYKFFHVPHHDVILFTGDYNPVTESTRLYTLCEQVLAVVSDLGVKRLFSIGAAQREKVVFEPRVFVASNSRRLIDQLASQNVAQLEGDGQITGFNGLIIGLASQIGVESACLLGEIDNPRIIQPRTVKNIVSTLARILQIPPIDTSALDEEEKKKESAVNEMEYWRRLSRSVSDSAGIA